MRTRTIVVLVVAGSALLFGPGILRSDHRATNAAQHSAEAPPQTTTRETAAPASTRSSSTSTKNLDVSPSSTSTTISPAEIQRQLTNVDRLERDQPLTQHLPHDEPHFNIDYKVGTDGKLTLQMTLRAVLNRADQLDQYRAQLRAYKAEALDWLRSLGADPGAYRIDYLPPEAARL